MIVYETVGPDGATRLDCADFEIAAAAVLLVGQGGIGADPTSGQGESVPIFLLGGAGDWFQDRFGRLVGQAVVDRSAEVAAALDSMEVIDQGEGTHPLSPDRLAFAAEQLSEGLKARRGKTPLLR